MRHIEYEQLHQAIVALTETQQRRLTFYYFRGLTYKRIAEMEGCPFLRLEARFVRQWKILKNFFQNRVAKNRLSEEIGRGVKTLCLFFSFMRRIGAFFDN